MGRGIEIGYGGYWCTPFVPTGGALTEQDGIDLAARLTRESTIAAFDDAVISVGNAAPGTHATAGLQSFADSAGLGPLPTQALSCGNLSGLSLLRSGVLETVTGAFTAAYCIGCGSAASVKESRLAWLSAIDTVARQSGVTREQLDQLLSHRWEQYEKCREDGFQGRFMPLPFWIGDSVYDGDTGLVEMTPGTLKEAPALFTEGVLSRAMTPTSKTAIACMVLGSAEGGPEALRLRIEGTGIHRESVTEGSTALLLAAQAALNEADSAIDTLDTINIFAPELASELLFANETGADVMTMNRGGGAVIWGDAGAATGLRATIEGIEHLTSRGGGHGLVAGAAEDGTAIALVIRVADRLPT
ncbi:MAG: hypothetical protein ACPGO3_15770 [Magnetospiraceae bacterium]